MSVKNPIKIKFSKLPILSCKAFQGVWYGNITDKNLYVANVARVPRFWWPISQWIPTRCIASQGVLMGLPAGWLRRMAALDLTLTFLCHQIYFAVGKCTRVPVTHHTRDGSYKILYVQNRIYNTSFHNQIPFT